MSRKSRKSRILLVNFKDFSLNQDIKKTIQPFVPFCICCLDRKGPMIDLNSCEHSDYLDSFSHPKLKQFNQLVCLKCHSRLQMIKSFQTQLLESCDILLSGSYTNTTVNSKRLYRLIIQKVVDNLYLPPVIDTNLNNDITEDNMANLVDEHFLGLDNNDVDETASYLIPMPKEGTLIQEDDRLDLDEILDATIEGSFEGNIEGNFEGNIEGNIEANIKGNIEENIDGNIEENIEGNFESTFEGNIEENIEGNIDENFEGNIEENFESNYEGNIGKNIERSFEGNIEENFEGNFEGNIEENFEANFEGNIEGTFEGNFEGNIEEIIEENFEGNMEENIEGSFDGNIEEHFDGNIEENIEGNFERNIELNFEGSYEGNNQGNIEENKNIRTALEILERNNQSFMTLGSQLQFLNGEHLSFLEPSLLSKEMLTDIPFVPSKNLSADLDSVLLNGSNPLEIEIDQPDNNFYNGLGLSPDLIGEDVNISEMINMNSSAINVTELQINEKVVNKEVINEEVITEKVINEEVMTEEVMTEEVINEEVINEEVINEEVMNGEVMNEEVIEPKKAKKVAQNKNAPVPIITVKLTPEQLNRERVILAQSNGYLKYTFRCDTCLVGFYFEDNLDDHMKRKHRPKNADSIICTICYQAIPTAGELTEHNYRHYTRYECTICNKRYKTHNDAIHHSSTSICVRIANHRHTAALNKKRNQAKSKKAKPKQKQAKN